MGEALPKNPALRTYVDWTALDPAGEAIGVSLGAGLSRGLRSLKETRSAEKGKQAAGEFFGKSGVRTDTGEGSLLPMKEPSVLYPDQAQEWLTSTGGWTRNPRKANPQQRQIPKEEFDAMLPAGKQTDLFKTDLSDPMARSAQTFAEETGGPFGYYTRIKDANTGEWTEHFLVDPESALSYVRKIEDKKVQEAMLKAIAGEDLKTVYDHLIHEGLEEMQPQLVSYAKNLRRESPFKSIREVKEELGGDVSRLPDSEQAAMINDSHSGIKYSLSDDILTIAKTIESKAGIRGDGVLVRPIRKIQKASMDIDESVSSFQKELNRHLDAAGITHWTNPRDVVRKTAVKGFRKLTKRGQRSQEASEKVVEALESGLNDKEMAAKGFSREERELVRFCLLLTNRESCKGWSQ